MDDKEIWKDVIGYEGLYQVSNLGRICSLPKKTHKNIIIIRQIYDGYGYLQVRLYKNGNVQTHKVHKLVAVAFIPNPDKEKEINHKDENKLNNKVENLEWCNRKYNLNYGSYPSKMASIMLNRKDESKSIGQYTKDGILIRNWVSSAEIKRQCGFDRSNICACCRGLRKSAHGFIWKFNN